MYAAHINLSPPRIVSAANRVFRVTESGEPEILVVAGARHHDGVMNPVLKKLYDLGFVRAEENSQGFIDQHGKFYTRSEAWAVAQANDQIIRRVGGDDGCLYSENLY